MNKFEKFTEIIEKIYAINPDENFGDKVFKLFKEAVDFDEGYIFFSNPERLEYSFNPRAASLKEIQEPALKENLEFKNLVFGTIAISGKAFTQEDKKIFRTFASIISNLIKDIELTKVVKMQIEALQQGYIETREHSQKIKEADKIKTKFFSHTTHELRTPLNSILGFSELLGNEFAGKLNKKQKEYVEDIKISGINLLGLINEILDMSKIEANAMKLNLQTFQVSLAVNEVINTVSPLIIKKHINLSKFIDNITLTADYQKFQQILFNLLGNAVKYTQENGKIVIKAKQEQQNLILSVKDNGAGIDKKLQKTIFKPFTQGDKIASNSTGLGLAITNELVKLHKGKITIKSEPEKGAEFIVSIPLAQKWDLYRSLH